MVDAGEQQTEGTITLAGQINGRKGTDTGTEH